MNEPVRVLLVTTVPALLLASGCTDEPTAPGNGRTSTLAFDTQIDQTGDFEKDVPGHAFSDVEIFLEYNATDHDLGVQIFLDGEDWTRLKAIDPNHRKMFEITANGPLAWLGITELRFESAEPSPEEVLALFEPGVYRFFGRTLEGEVLAGEGELHSDLPPAPELTVSLGESVRVAAVVSWNAMAGLSRHQVIVVNESTGATMEIDLPGTATSISIPAEFLAPGTEHKVEVLAIAPNGNKTITERSFVTGP